MQMLEERDEWSAVKPGPEGGREGGGTPAGVSMVRPGPAKSLTYRAGLRPEFDLGNTIRAPREQES